MRFLQGVSTIRRKSPVSNATFPKVFDTYGNVYVVGVY